MQTLIILTLILSAIDLIAVVVLAVRLPRGKGTDAEALRRLEEKTDSVGTLADYTARALDALNRSTEQRLAFIQKSLSDDMKYIVDSNAQNLERIRRTVDEKLTDSIDGKLSESYARITERLEKMYESVGEMKSLSTNVSEIRRVFSNVKLRGTWGEAQLDALLGQMLSSDQYERSVKLNPLDGTIVDFAIRLPSKNGETVYLPVDSKFPVEEFERLVAASERGDREGADRARKNLERAVKVQADSIVKKYVLPPKTTDFAVMYLPSEALYAEAMRESGLSDYLRVRRVIACGPTNFAALLCTLQTGFRTAAIEKRSGELSRMLEEFRRDFARFSEALEKTRKKLQEAQDAVETTEKRTGSIGKKLEGMCGEAELPPPDEE